MELSNQTMTIGQGVTSSMTSTIVRYDDVISSTQKKITQQQPSSSTALIAMHGIFYGTILFLGMLFNCCVIWLIRRKRSLHTVTNMWVTSLCISQVLICAISLPIIIISSLADDWLLGSTFCRIFGFYTTCLRTVSILSVAGIALDRYHIVTRPFSTRIRKSSARLLILLTWWAGIVASVPPLFGIGLYRYSPGSHTCGISWSLGGSALVFTVFYITSVYVVTLMTTSFSYKLIYKVTKAQADKRKRPSIAGGLGSSIAGQRSKSIQELGGASMVDEDMQINSYTVGTKKISPARRRLTTVLNGKLHRGRGSLRHRLSTSLSGYYSHSNIDNRAALAIILVLVTFLCTWLPYFTFGLYSAIAGNIQYPGPSSARSWTDFITTWLSFSNVVWDPLLYGALNHNFRAHFREWHCCCHFSFSSVLRKYNGNFRSSDSDNDAQVNSSVTMTTNWREIVKTQEIQQTENEEDFQPKDYFQRRNNSSHTMTSFCGDVTQPHTFSTRESKIFYIAEKEDTSPNEFSSPRNVRKQSEYSRQSLTSQIHETPSNYAPKVFNFDDVTVDTSSRKEPEGSGIETQKPLPLGSVENERSYDSSRLVKPASNISESKPNEFLSNDGDVFSNVIPSEIRNYGRLRSKSQIQSIFPAHVAENLPKSEIRTFSKSSSSLSGTGRVKNRRLSSESERRRREKVRQVRASHPRARSRRTNDSTTAL